MTRQPEFDLAIVGAGIAGASTAFFASRRASVLLLEAEERPGLHSTGRSAALFCESYGPAQVRALTRASRAFLESPPRGFASVPLLAPRGVLHVGGDVDRPALEALREHLSLEGAAARRLSGDSLLEMVPVLRSGVLTQGLLDGAAADMDVDALHQGFLRGARANAARLEARARVTRIEREQGGWRLEAGGREWRAAVLVNAAGAWADEVANLAGVRPIGLQPKRRSAFLFEAPRDLAIADWPCVVGIAEDFYFKPEAGLLLGSPANADPVPPQDVMPDDLDIAVGIDRIEQVTTLRIERPRRTWAGLRSFVADGELVGGFDPEVAGFFWVAALGGYGLQTAPAMGAVSAARLLSLPLPDWAVDHGVSESALDPGRFVSSGDCV
ncbi:MAG TPA: FAD-binding oxidoreductase [Steroidobacteraceae bacterium]|nr:FAD-binding oxidoreductase [Steroidobacteraceae bacterium]